MSFHRATIKKEAKRNLRANYWPCVFVAFLFILFFSTNAGSVGDRAGKEIRSTAAVQTTAAGLEVNHPDEEFLSDPNASISELFGTLENWNNSGRRFEDITAGNIVRAGTAAGGIGLVILLLNLFLFGPLKMGCYRFFAANTNPPAKVGEIGTAFRQDYFGNVLTMFLVGLFTALWTLLFVIPGIVKAYSYRMTPYIKMDHPELSATECITRSREMMKGNKMRAFVLDLSFLGWFLLELITLGIVGIFWVQPYYQQTDAQLYRALSGNGNRE